MPQISLLTTKYEYEKKSCIESFADACLTPCHYFLGGRSIKMAFVDRQDENEWYQSQVRHELDGFVSLSIEFQRTWWKTALAAVAFLPGLTIGKIAKEIACKFSSLQEYRNVAGRYDTIYSSKKPVEEKLAFQLSCARAQQRRQVPVQNNLGFFVNNDTQVDLEEWDDLAAGAAETIGLRDKMEDAHVATRFYIYLSRKEYEVKLYGVFDGHGGQDTANFMRDNLEKKLISIFKRNRAKELSPELVTNAITEACISLDIEFRKENKNCGTTSTFALMINKKIYFANSGDGRAIIVKTEETIQVTEDAKPEEERFKRSVEKSGSFVCSGRVDGILGTARDMGMTGRFGITARPKITCVDEEDGMFLVLGCDGLWDVMTTDEVGDDVRNEDPLVTESAIAEKLVKKSLMKGTQDNVTVMVVRVKTP